MHKRMRMHTNLNMPIHLYVRVHAKHVHMHMQMQLYMHMYMYMHKHTRTCTCPSAHRRPAPPDHCPDEKRGRKHPRPVGPHLHVTPGPRRRCRETIRKALPVHSARSALTRRPRPTSGDRRLAPTSRTGLNPCKDLASWPSPTALGQGSLSHSRAVFMRPVWPQTVRTSDGDAVSAFGGRRGAAPPALTPPDISCKRPRASGSATRSPTPTAAMAPTRIERLHRSRARNSLDTIFLTPSIMSRSSPRPRLRKVGPPRHWTRSNPARSQVRSELQLCIDIRKSAGMCTSVHMLV